MQYDNILQEGLNSLIPLTQTIHENYQMFYKKYFLFRGVPSDCYLMVSGQKYAKINFNNSHYAILYKYMENIEFNTIAGVPSTGPYFLYIYVSNTHPLIYEIN